MHQAIIKSLQFSLSYQAIIKLLSITCSNSRSVLRLFESRKIVNHGNVIQIVRSHQGRQNYSINKNNN